MTTLLAIALIAQSTLVPDANYVPVAGDDVRIYRRADNGALLPAPSAFLEGDYESVSAAAWANDKVGLKDLLETGKLAMLDAGTQVKVIAPCTVGMNPIYRTVDGRRYVNGHTQPARYRYYEVRAIDGKYKDRTLFVEKDWVKRCAVVAPKGKAKSKKK